MLGREHFDDAGRHRFPIEPQNGEHELTTVCHFQKHALSMLTKSKQISVRRQSSCIHSGPEYWKGHGLWRAASQPRGTLVLWVSSNMQVPEDLTCCAGWRPPTLKEYCSFSIACIQRSPITDLFPCICCSNS